MGGNMDITALPEPESPQQMASIAPEASLPPLPPHPLPLNHPSARLSSSPASSPHIVESPFSRKGSVHPEMSMMDKGAAPGADFFDDSSAEDDSEWEDDNGTRTFSEVEGLGISNSMLRQTMLMNDGQEEETRGRKRPSDIVRNFIQMPTPDRSTAAADDESLARIESENTKRAHEMPLRRFESVRVVHNRGSGSAGRNTARESIMSSGGSGIVSTTGGPSKPSTELRGGRGEEASPRARFMGRHRRNTSESLRADSILNAHAITMQALEALSPNASLSHGHGHLGSLSRSSFSYANQRSTSFSDHRRVVFSPLHPQQPDPDRPAHLPAHFVKTPYPFTTRKEFPKPKTRPRQIGLTNGISPGEYDYDEKRGRHHLGLVASEGGYDLRSRLERNEDGQGFTRAARQSGDGARETAIWLSLRRRRNTEVTNHLEHIIIPSSLTTSPERTGGKKRKMMSKHDTLDFDDMFLAQELRYAYKSLAGPWYLRLLSARKLRYIRLGVVPVWSGSSSLLQSGSGRGSQNDAEAGRLLAARDGFDTGHDAQSPFTEHNLMHLFRHPNVGKARYTWVHWARRLSASNAPVRSATSASQSSRRLRAQSLDTSTTPSMAMFSVPLHAHSSSVHPSALTTIQFVHAFSPARIVAVLAMLLVLSVLAPLLWIFLGESASKGLSETRARADRVGSGIAVGGLVLAVEAVGFLAWLVGSWVWG